MGPTELLVYEWGERKEPLGSPLLPGEVQGLIERLRHRLEASADELNISPASLKRLESRLADYYRVTQAHPLSEEELVRLVREVAAYIGHVLVTHAGGRWADDNLELWGTAVVFDGPWEVMEEHGRETSPFRAGFLMGGEAAWAWDTIEAGGKPNLYNKLYRRAKSKYLPRERL